jgi:thioredoxin reductase (NADPH)
MSATHRTDVAIIGAGPVGLFAVFECGMLKMRTHVIDTLDVPGGQCAALYPEKPIYDIPGHPAIDAAALVERLEQQAAPFRPEYTLGQQVERVSRQADGRILVETSGGVRIDAGAAIVAAGVGAFGPNRPPLDGIERYEGKGVFYYVKRREDFRGKRVLIAGGGDSALDWAINLVDVAERVLVVHRRPKFRGAPDSVLRLQKLAAEGRLDLLVPYQLFGLEGEDGRLAAVTLADLQGTTKRVPADALLAFFGLAMDLGPIASWGIARDETRHHIRIDPAARVEALRAEAQELRVLAQAARSQGVRNLLNIEAADREEQAEALANWLNAGEQNPG